MNIRLRRIFPAALTALLCFACIFDKEAKGGSVVENEVLAGILYAENGTPAADAEVKIIPVDHLPHNGLIKRGTDTTPVFTFQTDAQGRYFPKDLPSGAYNIFGKAGDRVSYLDSVAITDSTGVLPSDTLAKAGSIAGTVVLEPNHDPRTVFVQLLGTETFTAADSAGGFAFGGLAGGTYAIRVVTSLGQYSQYFGVARVRSGEADFLDTIRLTYTGIPVVRGLRITYDTAAMAARLEWNPVSFKFIKDYEISRNVVGALGTTPMPVGRTSGTAFIDSLAAAIDASPGTGPMVFEYRIRVRNQSEETGLPWGTVGVVAIAVDSVRTSVWIGEDPGKPYRASIGDTLKLAAIWKNPSRGNDSLAWIRESDQAVIRAIAISGKQGVDSLRFTLPQKAGPAGITIRIKDERGNYWNGRNEVTVVLDPPDITVGKDTTVTISDRVNLSGASSQEFGSIVKWEWDFGATGKFVRVSKPDTQAQVPGKAGAYRCVLRGYDDDGNVGYDTLVIAVIQDVPVVTASGDTLVTVLDTIRLSGASLDSNPATLKWAWDIGNTGNFIPVPGPDIGVPAPATPGPFTCVLKATDEDGNSSTSPVRITVVNDRPKMTLNIKSRFVGEGGGYSIRAVASDIGRIVKWEWDFGALGTFLLGSGPDTAIYPTAATGTHLSMRARIWDEDGNFAQVDTTFAVSKWALLRFPFSPDGVNTYDGVPSAELGGKIYYAGGELTNRRQAVFDEAYSFEPSTGKYDTLPPMLEKRARHGLVAVDGKLYAMSGWDGKEVKGTMEAFDPSTRKWTTKANVPVRKEYCASAAMNGKIYVFEGLTVHVYDPVSDRWTVNPHSPINNPGMQNPQSGAMAGVGGKIYVLASSNSNSNDFSMLRYDPLSDTWERVTKASLFYQSTPAFATYAGNLYSIGDEYNGNGFRVQIYDPVANSWQEKSKLLERVFWGASTVVDGRIYSLGTGGLIQVYDPALDP